MLIMKSNTGRILLIGMVCSIVMFCVSCGSTQGASSQASSAAADTVKAASNQTVDAFGVIKAGATKSISIDFPAIVEKVNVKEGQKVKKGDTLLTLNISELKEQIKSKQAELDLEKRYIASKQATDPDLDKLLSDLENAQTLYSKGIKDLQTKETLLGSGSISRLEFDDFQKSVDALKKAVDDLNFSIESYKANKKSDLDQRRTRVITLTSEITVLKENLNKSYLKDNLIVCDIENGLVTDLKPSPGYLATAPDMLLNIVDLNSINILADVDEAAIKDVRPGAKVTVVPLADRSKSINGKVTRITDRAIVKNGQTFVQVEIDVDNNDSFLQLDYNVDVKIAKG